MIFFASGDLSQRIKLRVGPGSPRRKKFNTQPSDHSFFWDTKGVIMFTQEKYNNWSVLCKLARPTENNHPLKLPR